MDKKVFVGSFQVPGCGGASTASYALFQMIKQYGFNASYVNLLSDIDVDYLRYVFSERLGNPKCLDHVYNCVLNGSLFSSHAELTELLSEVSPDLMIGVGSLATLLMKQALPQKPLIFLAPSCGQATAYVVNRKHRDAIRLTEFLRGAKSQLNLPDIDEAKAADISDLIIANSEMSLLFFQYFFPSHRGKIFPDPIWAAEWTRSDALDYSWLQRPFDDRDIDVLFVASRWRRPEKNYELVRKIVSRCSGLAIHIVGDVERKDTHATYHGFVTRREELFSLFGRAKTVVCPSRIDSAPGILFQAAAMGCNVVASKNCGNWKICHEDLLVDRLHADNFVEKIEHGLSRKYGDNIDYFLGMECFKNLADILLVF